MVQLSLKLFLNPELSKNRRNSQFSPEKRYFLNFWSCTLYFFMKFCTQTQCLKCDGVRFCKNFFSGRKCLKYAGKISFWAFSRDFIISFLIFCSKMRIRNAQNMAEACHFFPAENAGIMPEIAAFPVFHLTFFL